MPRQPTNLNNAPIITDLAFDAMQFTKGAAVVAMVFVHSMVWLIANEDVGLQPDTFLWPLIQKLSSLGLFPLMLPVLAGISYARWHLRNKPSSSFARGFTVALIIAVSLAVLSVVTNWVSWGISARPDWDVLAFIGLSWVLLAFFDGLRIGVVADAVAIGVVLLSPFLRDQYGETLLGKIALGSKEPGFYWPLVPWFALVVGGRRFAFLAHRFARNPQANRWLQSRKLFSLAILVMVVSCAILFTILLRDPALVTFGQQNFWGEGVFKPGPLTLSAVALLFIALTALGVVFRLAGSPRIFGRYSIISCFATGILWIYLGHQIVGAHLSYWLKKIGFFAPVSLLFFMILFFTSWAIGAFVVFIHGHRIRLVLRRQV